MATVINRSTKSLFYSVNTPDYSDIDWIINPDLSQLTSVPQKYWKIYGDLVLEMTTPEKAVVDAGIASNTFPPSMDVATSVSSSTTNTAYTTKLSFDINLEAIKEYEISYNFVWSYSATTSSFKYRLTHFKDELISLAQVSVTPTLATDILNVYNAKNFSVLTSGVYTIKLEFAAGASTKTATITEASLNIRRI